MTSWVRALCLRETSMSALLLPATAMAVVCIGAAFAAADAAASVTGSASLLLRFDETMAGILVLIAVFRTVSRASSDMESDWMLQLVAGGRSREGYIAMLCVAVAISSFALYISAALPFALTDLWLSGRATAFRRVLRDLPSVVLMMIAAAVFGAALVCVAGRVASRVAALLVAAPWVAFALTLMTREGAATQVYVIRTIGRAAPPVFTTTDLHGIMRMIIYDSVFASIALLCAGARIGRVR